MLRLSLLLFAGCTGSTVPGTDLTIPTDTTPTDVATSGTTGDSGGKTKSGPTITITSPVDGATLTEVDGVWGPAVTVTFEMAGCELNTECSIYAYVDGERALDTEGDELWHYTPKPMELLLPDFGTFDITLELLDRQAKPLGSSKPVQVQVPSTFAAGTPEALVCGEPEVPHNVALYNGAITTIGLEDDQTGWASGFGGTFRLEKGVWQAPNDLVLTDLEVTGPGTGWAISQADELYRLSSGEWAPYDPGFDTTAYSLQYIDMVDDDNGFVTSTEGVVLHLKEGAWTAAQVKGPSFRRVWALDADHAWAQTYDSKTITWGLWTYDSGTWAPYEGATPPINDGALSDFSTGYFAGGTGVYAMSGGVPSTTSLVTPTASCVDDRLLAIRSWGTSNAWVVGWDGCTWELSGGTWTESRCAICGDFRTLELTAADRGWAGVESAPFDTRGSLVRLEGGTFTPEEFDQWPLGPNIRVGQLLSDHAGWIARGSLLFRRHTGEDWEPFLPVTSSLGLDDIEGMAFQSPYAGWFHTADGVYELRYGRISTVTPAKVNTLNDIAVQGSTGVLVGGNSGGPIVGDIYELDAKGAWVALSFNATQELQAVALANANDGWAVGGTPFGAQGVLVQRQGGTWTEVHAKVPPLFDVALVDENNGWAVGGHFDSKDRPVPFLYQLRDGVWSEVSVAADTVFTAVGLRPDGTGWAAGSGGVVVELSPSGATICPEGQHYGANAMSDVIVSPETGRTLLLGERRFAMIAYWL